MPPTVPIHHYSGPQTNKIEPASYSIIPCCRIQADACYEHSNFVKVKGSKASDVQQSPSPSAPSLAASAEYWLASDPVDTPITLDYGSFNCNNFNIRYWSWNYRGCWHQTCPPIDTRGNVYTPLITNCVALRAPHCYFLSLPPRVGIG